MKNHRYKSAALWIIILFSIASLFFSPTKPIIEQLRNNLPWVASGILLSEIILTLGFITMLSVATPAFIRSLTKSTRDAFLGIVHIKKKVEEFDWAHVANKCNRSNLFWLGFWLSIIGASGDGIILIIAIGDTLPVTSWGMMILPFWDLGLTFIIRKAIFRGIKKHQVLKEFN